MTPREWLAAHGIGEAQLAARDATVGMERAALDPALAALIPGYYAEDKSVANKIDLIKQYLDTELPASFNPGAVLSEQQVVGAGDNYNSGTTPAADYGRFQQLGAPVNAAPPPGQISGGSSGDWFAQHAPAGSPFAASTAPQRRHQADRATARMPASMSRTARLRVQHPSVAPLRSRHGARPTRIRRRRTWRLAQVISPRKPRCSAVLSGVRRRKGRSSVAALPAVRCLGRWANMPRQPMAISRHGHGISISSGTVSSKAGSITRWRREV